MEFHFKTSEEALAKCRELTIEKRYNLFRGQTHDWPRMLPSRFRAGAPGKRSADEHIKVFTEWASHVPQMAAYWSQLHAISAIAQHYGVPTNLLDVTSDPEIAILFSKSEIKIDGEAVIYVFSREDITSTQGLDLISIDVSNLWRLEAQREKFVEVEDEYACDILKELCIKIFFPCEVISEEEKVRIYPIRKSSLEVVLDQFFYRDSLESLISQMSMNTQSYAPTHRETYPGVFRWREAPLLDPSWFNSDPRWIAAARESVDIIGNSIPIELPSIDLNAVDSEISRLALLLSQAIGGYRGIISFSVPLIIDGKAPKNNEKNFSRNISVLIDRCWDGIRVLPYEDEEVVYCIACTYIMLVAATKSEGQLERAITALFGECVSIEVAPVGGHIESGRVSRADLSRARILNPSSLLTAYARRKCLEDDGWLNLYVVDVWILFDFIKFKSIFIKQFVPTALGFYWRSDIEGSKGNLEGLWSISFNPILLGFVTEFNYRFRSPISGEIDCEKIIYIEPDMTKTDIEEAFVSCLPSVLTGGDPFVLRFNGYSTDEREVWEIPEVLEQCKVIVEVGGISVLKVSTILDPDKVSMSARRLPPTGMGAFAIWLMAVDRLKDVVGKELDKDMIDLFFNELMVSNANIETRGLAMDDWPGARR